METKGQKARAKMPSPSSLDVAATEWLLLYSLTEYKKVSIVKIEDVLKMYSKKINTVNKNFYLVWPNGNLSSAIYRFHELKLIRRSVGKNGLSKWTLTKAGEKVLLDWWPKVKLLISPPIEFKNL
jgi:hypothetical protein